LKLRFDSPPTQLLPSVEQGSAGGRPAALIAKWQMRPFVRC